LVVAVPDHGEYVGQGLRKARRGLYALEHASGFNVLCIAAPAGAIDVDPATYAAASEYCEERRAVLLIDAPVSWTTPKAVHAQAILDAVGRRSANSAIFFPRLSTPPSSSPDRSETVGPAGAIAGVYARIDLEHGIWKAPAGESAYLEAQGLSVEVDEGEARRLYAMGVNCLRALPGIGPVIWGSRTLETSERPELRYVSVRRTTLFIEESLYRGTQWAVFEPSNAHLWRLLRESAAMFMSQLHRAGAFAGATPTEAFFVKCGPDTMTDEDVRNGLLNIEVGFAPIEPAEFVVVRLQMKTAA
jgi:phage tail sheath protein FI